MIEIHTETKNNCIITFEASIYEERKKTKKNVKFEMLL
jgi:hypothetical protein